MKGTVMDITDLNNIITGLEIHLADLMLEDERNWSAIDDVVEQIGKYRAIRVAEIEEIMRWADERLEARAGK